MHTQSPKLVPEPTPTLLERLPVLRRGLDRLERKPTAFGLVMWAFGLAKPVFLDHVVTPEPRAELGPVRELLEKNRECYAEHLTGFLDYADQLAGIPLKGVEKASTAYWGNTWLPRWTRSRSMASSPPRGRPAISRSAPGTPPSSPAGPSRTSV